MIHALSVSETGVSLKWTLFSANKQPLCNEKDFSTTIINDFAWLFPFCSEISSLLLVLFKQNYTKITGYNGQLDSIYHYKAVERFQLSS